MTDAFNEDMAPLFLAYGKACYQAQNLESTLRYLLVVIRSQRDQIALSDKAALEIETETAREAVFALFDRAKRAEYFTPEEERLVKKAMHSRNHLMHEFWNKHALLALTQDGRNWIVNELSRINKQMRSADKIIVDLADRYTVEYGLTTEICKLLVSQSYESGNLPDDVTTH